MLNDGKTSHAPFIRYYLEQSNTLFGKIFIHMAEHYREYFGGLFEVCNKKNNPNWKSNLKKASFASKNDENDDKNIYQTISKEQIQHLFTGISKSGNSFKLRKEQVEFAYHVADALTEMRLRMFTVPSPYILVMKLLFIHRTKQTTCFMESGLCRSRLFPVGAHPLNIF